jgi:hypothetical protein
MVTAKSASLASVAESIGLFPNPACLALSSDRRWRRLTDLAGRPAWLMDGRGLTPPNARADHQ